MKSENVFVTNKIAENFISCQKKDDYYKLWFFWNKEEILFFD